MRIPEKSSNHKITKAGAEIAHLCSNSQKQLIFVAKSPLLSCTGINPFTRSPQKDNPLQGNALGQLVPANVVNEGEALDMHSGSVSRDVLARDREH